MKVKVLTAVLILFFFTACNSFNTDSAKILDRKYFSTSFNADFLLSEIKNNNNIPDTFKGVGKITLLDEKGFQTARIAWAGSGREKIRIVILGPGGHPVISTACNGKYIYFLSHADQHLYIKKKSDKIIKKFTGIPLQFTDIISLLTGCVPIREHSAVLVSRDEFSNKNTLILKKNRHNISEKIFLNENNIIVQKIEVFNSKGGISYSAEFKQIDSFGNCNIPKQIKIVNDNVEINLSIDKFWTDVDISPSLFILNKK